MVDPVTVEMFVDISCPWCHGALETSRRVLDELHGDPALPPLQLTWRFMRLRELPSEGGLTLDEYFGSWGDSSPEALERARQEVRDYARSVGVRVDFTRFTFLHDPFTAHRLLALVRDEDEGRDALPSLWSLARAVFTANFVHGIDITDHAALRGAVERSGLWLPARTWTRLAGGDHVDETRADRERALEVELDGVPRMYVNGRIVPTWIEPDEIRRRLREAVLALSV